MAQSSSASATASTAPDSDYDVFISHRGPDVKKTFASHLYRSLKSQHGLRVFLDQPELQRGEYLIPQIEAAIRSASVHVAIFSKGYAESTWCLQELVSMLESNFPVIPVFYDVKPAELRWTQGKEGGYAKALEELEKKTTVDPDTGFKKWRYETSLIKKWRNALSQAAGISGFELEACNGDEGKLLDDVVEGVLKKVKKPAKVTVSSAPLLQPVPQSGFVGKRIKDDQDRLQRWLENEDHQFRIIGVYGMGGIGKTSFLKTLFNAYKKGNLFEAVIWTVVSQNCSISGLQADIAAQINLNLGSSSVELAQMKLSACLREKKFLLILDDLWEELLLHEELGIPVNNDKGSRVLISSRSSDVLKRMEADDLSIQIQPLSRDEGWQLFCRGAFKTGSAPTEDIGNVATQIAGECNGLPLAINVIAAAMKGKTSVNDWHLAFCQIKYMDPTFLKYTRIDRGLYWRLKLSYDCLPDSDIKNCFLYCATFPEDWSSIVTSLVEMWIGEGLVKSRETSYLMDLGLRYVDLLVERCLFQSVYDDETGDMKIVVHDLVHDLAMYIAENEEQCFFRTRQNLQEFPAAEKGIHNCKRITIGHNNISDLPTDFSCPNLLTLMLDNNERLREVPDGFLVNLTSLRVLDLSGTKIESLPMSLWHLTQLQYLDLTETLIKDLPEDICNLSQLQFLHLHSCRQLKSLPCTMGQLENLRTLNLNSCCSLTGIPREISQLTSLNKLLLWTSETEKNNIMEVEEVKSSVCTLRDLTNCSNLVQLAVHVKAGIEVEGIRAGIKMGIMGSWLDMRDLRLAFDAEDHDVLEDLPRDMRSMKKLQQFWLGNYHGRSLPNCIAEFPQLERLYLYCCFQLRDLPPLERLPNLRSLSLEHCINLKELGIGAWGSVRGFPRLESLTLKHLPMLESLGSSSSDDVVWNEQSVPKLKVLTIKDCPSLKGLPRGIDNLPDLETIKVQQNWWEKNDVEIFLKEKLHHSIVFME